MRRLVFVWSVAVCLLCVGVFSGESEAGTLKKKVLSGFSMTLSGGANYDFLVNDSKKSKRLGLNTELMLSYQLLIVSADLGGVYDFAKQRFVARPGLRLFLGWLYLRAAIPIVIPADPNDDFDVGVLIGAGIRIKATKRLFFTFEGSVSPFFININEHGVSMPAELRLGIGVRF
ncbi:MAG: hypothetical protein CL920_14805 [Deltaproteobacteria bacterium]|nr:hypothetical protein [Deltaproteobacteria bacterium]MBU49955.1 hypothetical protein [Deltaproteobacteria bacterium]